MQFIQYDISGVYVAQCSALLFMDFFVKHKAILMYWNYMCAVTDGLQKHIIVKLY